ncbi:MAG: glycine--tRNA ligase [Candidatus Levyibacteriota bacterium]|jgi:glycyl-tRNA synthetase
MENLMDKLVALCKRRGFIFPGSELYGGLNGTWDLGPAGVLLANNLKNEWWTSMVLKNDNIVGIDSSIVLNAKVWEASGHIASFTDPLIECKVCHARFRADNKQEIEEHAKLHEGKGKWTDVKDFNLMFKTFVGSVDNEDNKTYLRPETAQGIFINYKSVLESTRVRVPFGIAQIGKGFRNEITTGNFLFRVREFEMMELEYFVKPDEASKAHKDWIEKRFDWYVALGIDPKNLKKEELDKKDLAHYSRGTTEIWYNWPFMGFAELEGIANRGDYDLSVHQKASGRDLSYFDEETKEKFIPYVIEPSVGVGRAMLAFLLDAYREDGKRVFLKLHPKLAPYKVAVFPLLANKSELVDKARLFYEDLRKNMMVAWDDRGNIGKRYFAQDEIGTPFCITVDFQTLEDDTVTIRNRDTGKQDRISISGFPAYYNDKVNNY